VPAELTCAYSSQGGAEKQPEAAKPSASLPGEHFKTNKLGEAVISQLSGVRKPPMMAGAIFCEDRERK
jgi:hypothetical protein